MKRQDSRTEELMTKTANLLDKFKSGSPAQQQKFLKRMDELILEEKARDESADDSSADFLTDLKALLEMEARTV